MRATTCWMPKVSRATRAAMMFELSPLLTAANASARSIPASVSTFWSKPYPVTLIPLNEGPSRRKASGLLSMMLTVWLRSSSERASVDPTRPQPMITTCTWGTLLHLLAAAARARGDGHRSNCTTCPTVVDRGSWWSVETDSPRPQAPQLAAGGDLAAEADRPARLRQRRPLVGRLRTGRGLHHALGRGRVDVRLVLEDRHRGRPGDAGRDRVVPADRARVPVGRG